eukprot:scaffold23572_cov132-Skeletonema_dohrnii-CCMP3373.AAC.1
MPEENNPKLGFIPAALLRSNHKLSVDDTIATHREFFRVEKNVRTGKSFVTYDEHFNSNNQPVHPGAIINFKPTEENSNEAVPPIKFIQTRRLEFWLSCRGVTTCDMDRQQMISMVEKCWRNY